MEPVSAIAVPIAVSAQWKSIVRKEIVQQAVLLMRTVIPAMYVILRLRRVKKSFARILMLIVPSKNIATELQVNVFLLPVIFAVSVKVIPIVVAAEMFA